LAGKTFPLIHFKLEDTVGVRKLELDGPTEVTVLEIAMAERKRVNTLRRLVVGRAVIEKRPNASSLEHY
jgi:hypothetical protein